SSQADRPLDRRLRSRAGTAAGRTAPRPALRGARPRVRPPSRLSGSGARGPADSRSGGALAAPLPRGHPAETRPRPDRVKSRGQGPKGPAPATVQKPAPAAVQEMKRVDALLSDYGAHHRTRGNLVCHAFGITLIAWGSSAMLGALRVGSAN